MEKPDPVTRLIKDLETSPFAGRLCKRAAKTIRTIITREKALLDKLEAQALVIRHARELCQCEADATAQIYYRLKIAVNRLDQGTH